MSTPIIIDCDPGHDDAMALLLAYADPRTDLLAITTVGGNQTVEKCTLNARRVATIGNFQNVPIAEGAGKPLIRDLRIADDVHGDSGLDGPYFGEPTVDTVNEDAVALMYRILTSHPEQVTLVPTGPLTNVALLLRRHPEVASNIREIVWMGGSTERGNVTPYAEANACVDPEAADEVWKSGIEITMVGLNVTHQALVTQDVIDRIASIGTPLAKTCVELMTFFGSAYNEVWGFQAPPLHDPVAVARVLDPTIVRCEDFPVAIETGGKHTAGATVVDLHHLSGQPDNTHVALSLDRDRFWGTMIEAIRSYG
jgi:inosine-uridine nucleoside N-ribohydrolase